MARSIDRAFLGVLRTDIEAALATVGKRHGVLLSLNPGRFCSTDASFKLEVTPSDQQTLAAAVQGASPKDLKAAADYTKYCKDYGLKPEWLGQSFVCRGKTLTVIGLLPNKHVNNVLVEGTGGGKYIMPPGEVIGAF